MRRCCPGPGACVQGRAGMRGQQAGSGDPPLHAEVCRPSLTQTAQVWDKLLTATVAVNKPVLVTPELKRMHGGPRMHRGITPPDELTASPAQGQITAQSFTVLY